MQAGSDESRQVYGVPAQHCEAPQHCGGGPAQQVAPGAQQRPGPPPPGAQGTVPGSQAEHVCVDGSLHTSPGAQHVPPHTWANGQQLSPRQVSSGPQQLLPQTLLAMPPQQRLRLGSRHVSSPSQQLLPHTRSGVQHEPPAWQTFGSTQQPPPHTFSGAQQTPSGCTHIGADAGQQSSPQTSPLSGAQQTRRPGSRHTGLSVGQQYWLPHSSPMWSLKQQRPVLGLAQCMSLFTVSQHTVPQHCAPEEQQDWPPQHTASSEQLVPQASP